MSTSPSQRSNEVSPFEALDCGRHAFERSHRTAT